MGWEACCSIMHAEVAGGASSCMQAAQLCHACLLRSAARQPWGAQLLLPLCRRRGVAWRCTDGWQQRMLARPAVKVRGNFGLKVQQLRPWLSQDAAAGVLQRLDELSPDTSGRFVQAATGEALLW